MTRPIGLCLVVLFSLAACSAEQPVSPLQTTAGGPAQALATGDVVLLTTSAGLGEFAPFIMVVAGHSKFYGNAECPGTYELRGVITGQGDATELYSSQPLAAGTRLRFVEFVRYCDLALAWPVYAFEVVRGQD